VVKFHFTRVGAVELHVAHHRKRHDVVLPAKRARVASAALHPRSAAPIRIAALQPAFVVRERSPRE